MKRAAEDRSSLFPTSLPHVQDERSRLANTLRAVVAGSGTPCDADRQFNGLLIFP